MKAIIPVAGAGTKLRPHTYTQPKALIPLAGKTVLSIIVDQLCEAGIKKVDDPRDFGVAEMDDDGFIEHVVEKPHIPKSNMALVGLYKIKESDQMFQCLEENIRKGVRSHGEYSITDALDCMIQSGVKFKAFRVENWFDCGRKETLLESNATLFKKFG